MTGHEFFAWMELMGREGARLTDQAAADLLGVGRNTVHRYRQYKGQVLPKHIGLACGALAFGVPEWRRSAGAG